ncbi:hypothetical protein GJT88_01155 [Enterobacteriaceae endosymbiont of Donacia tomentosa]|uniref:OmpH family outer membrane protein n=1 Tax=Enterobacteriaceae endosymbiont of Donacia tomentosa TaxID=2675787 RepID=UPI001449725A|nr:OmpH family outer membrane protein [Enterobacteriaceae endosymbiont of Donacia tomentosa]QJC31662.1 hypothetical protein GJT88_01155 [Enterobacteriaceae endosymbiont of Donacia tomentosa]
MKFSLRAIILSVLILTFPVDKAFCFTQFAIVDITKVVQKIPQTQKTIKKLEKEFQPKIDKIKKIQDSIQLKTEKLKNNRLSIFSNEKNTLEKEIINEKNILAIQIKNFETELTKRQEEERAKLLHVIKKVINIVAKKNNYNIVFDSSALFYINNIDNLTDSVIEQMK